MVLHSIFFLLLRKNTIKGNILKQLALLIGNLSEGQGVSFVRQIEKLLLDNSNAKSVSLPTYLKCLLKVLHLTQVRVFG